MVPKAKHATQSEYFCAANTSSGFFSLFDEVFSPETLQTIYILKGGPGCGKSTALRRIAERAVKAGLHPELYACSSDPDSLDGVLIPERSVALLDGTAPHTCDPKYPAVCETIVDLGEGWDVEKAKAHAADIRRFGAEKRAAYGKAYAYLAACGSAEAILDGCASQYLLSEKMESAAARLCAQKKLTGKGSVRRVFTDSIGCLGTKHLTTFEDAATERYFIKDHAKAAHFYFDALFSALTRRNVDVSAALDPLEPKKIRGLYLPKYKMSFTLYDDDYALALDRRQIPYRIVNMARFVDSGRFRSQRVFYRYAVKCRKTLLDGALRELAKAGELHKQIEAHYGAFTDFGKIDGIVSALESRIFG